jgi:hypothetical protein
MLCLKCRYSLAALPRGPCPECGRAFDPNDPATFYVPRMFMLSSGWSRPPDRGHFTVALLASFVLLAAHWNVGTNDLLVYVALAAWAGLLLPLFLRSLLRIVPQRRHRLRVPTKRYCRQGGLLGLVAIATAVLIWVEAPLKTRYLLMYPRLRSVVDELAKSDRGILDLNQRAELPTAVAAFKIGNGQAIEIIPKYNESLPWNTDYRWEKDWFTWRGYDGVARFPTPPPTRINRSTIAGRMHYLTTGPRTEILDAVFEHMWGNWYLFRWETRVEYEDPSIVR